MGKSVYQGRRSQQPDAIQADSPRRDFRRPPIPRNARPAAPPNIVAPEPAPVPANAKPKNATRSKPVKFQRSYPYVWFPPAPVVDRSQLLKVRKRERFREADRRERVAKRKRLRELRQKFEEEDRQIALERRLQARETAKQRKEEERLKRIELRRLRFEQLRQEAQELLAWQRKHHIVLASLEPPHGPSAAPNFAGVHLASDALQMLLADTDFDAPFGLTEDSDEIDRVIREELGTSLPAVGPFPNLNRRQRKRIK